MPIDVSDLDKGAVLAALYNGSKPQGMGFMAYEPEPMTVAEANGLLDGQTRYFDYLKGRVMKVEVGGDSLEPRLYDRDNGEGAAERVITILRSTGNANAKVVEAQHRQATYESAEETRSRLHVPTTVSPGQVHLGLNDVAHKLGPKLDQAQA